MIGHLLPEWVSSVETFDDPSDAVLFPVERAVVSAAVVKRQREFTTGRACARRALAALGFPPMPLPRGPHGEPCWPDGVVGSITHCDGYRAAAVARVGQAAAVGIDAEPNEALPDGVLDTIALPQELPALRLLAAQWPEVSWERLLFSAKESVFKAWYPLAVRMLGFDQVAVTFDPVGGTFAGRILVDGPVLRSGGPLTGFGGRWLARDGLVLTAIALAR